MPILDIKKELIERIQAEQQDKDKSCFDWEANRHEGKISLLEEFLDNLNDNPVINPNYKIGYTLVKHYKDEAVPYSNIHLEFGVELEHLTHSQIDYLIEKLCILRDLNSHK